MDTPIQIPSQSPITPTVVSSETPVGSSSKKILLASLAALLVIGTGTFFWFSQSNTSVAQQVPPSLTMNSNGLKGSFVETKYGFLQYDDNDVKNFKAPVGLIASKLLAGVNYGVVTKQMTWWNMAHVNTNPAAKKAFFAYYDNDQQKFVTYPKGPFPGTITVSDDQAKTKILSEGQGVIIINEVDTDIYGIRTSSTKSDTPIKAFDPKANGWFLVSSNDANVAKATDTLGGRLNGIFAQKSATEFEKVNDPANYNLKDFYMLWVQIKPQDAASVPKNPLPPKIDSISPTTYEAPATQSESNPQLIIIDAAVTGNSLDKIDTATFDDPSINAIIDKAEITKISLKFTIDPAIIAGAKTLTLTAKDGTKLTSSFSITKKKEENADPVSDLNIGKEVIARKEITDNMWFKGTIEKIENNKYVVKFTEGPSDIKNSTVSLDASSVALLEQPLSLFKPNQKVIAIANSKYYYSAHIISKTDDSLEGQVVYKILFDGDVVATLEPITKIRISLKGEEIEAIQ